MYVCCGCAFFHAYLFLNGMSLDHHGIMVMTFGNAVDHNQLDLVLQVCVGALQGMHLEEDKETF